MRLTFSAARKGSRRRKICTDGEMHTVGKLLTVRQRLCYSTVCVRKEQVNAALFGKYQSHPAENRRCHRVMMPVCTHCEMEA